MEKKQDITDDPYLQFQVFYDNFKNFDGEDQKQISAVVAELMTKVRALGVPIYFKVMEGDGRAETTGVRVAD